ncbi:unnamed protein product [Caenorhabditis brenneri]
MQLRKVVKNWSNSKGRGWKTSNILEVNDALRDYGPVEVLHALTGLKWITRIQVCFSNCSQRMGRRHGRRTIAEEYLWRHHYTIAHPSDRCIWLEVLGTKVAFPAECLVVLLPPC